MNQRDLIAAAVGDLAVERVVAGIDHAAGEPAAVGAHRSIEDFFGRLDPVDLARRLGPKPLGVTERAGMHLVIPALFVDVHGALPARSPILLVMPGLVPGHDGWAAVFSLSGGIVTGSRGRSSWNSFGVAVRRRAITAGRSN